MGLKSLNQLKQRRAELLKPLSARLPAIGGSFAEAKATCGKPDCKCASGGEA